MYIAIKQIKSIFFNNLCNADLYICNYGLIIPCLIKHKLCYRVVYIILLMMIMLTYNIHSGLYKYIKLYINIYLLSAFSF